MVYQQANGSTTLPRGFRFHHCEGEPPRTPEPFTEDDPQQPSPPRPTRLKVRRRNVSSLQAPTEQFLASVAAADVPIPTIEVPDTDVPYYSTDSKMPDREAISIKTSGFLAPQTYYDFRLVSPPKTPMPMLSMDEGYSRRPDWAMDTSSPSDDYIQRPASSLSYTSDFSDDSFYSGSRLSRPSEDGSCTSPDSDIADPFHFPSYSKGKGKADHQDHLAQQRLSTVIRCKARKDAPWSRAMSAHLWSTYLVYLQDPTVTPFRIGASAVPPEGVCHRVAREARRSWKGPKLGVPAVRRSVGASSASSSISHRAASDKSGSITPTGEAPKVYAKWPHSSAATRSHLRQLCKSQDSTSVQRYRHLQSRSPTPFTRKSYFRSQPRTPEAPRLATFNTKDIALSLTTSTAETMQPDGPLASLAASNESPDTPTTPSAFTSLKGLEHLGFGEAQGLGITIEDGVRLRRLGSPFIARTYGPSSSRPSNGQSQSQPSLLRTQGDLVAVAGPHLRSPLQFDKPRSLNSTQKRRAQHALEEELSPSGAVLRPSILNEQLFGTPLKRNQRRVRSRGFSLGDEASRNNVSGPVQPDNVSGPVQPSQVAIDNPTYSTSTISTSDGATSAIAAPILLPPPTFDPPRLGSPFSGSGPNNTFPRRLFQDGTATTRRSVFATMHQTRRSIESFDFGEGPSLQSRLSHLDQRLAEIRDRSSTANKQNLERSISGD